MICYKDMTFCKYHDECKIGVCCHRALTEKVKKDAKVFGLGVCVFSEYPDCYEDKEGDE